MNSPARPVAARDRALRVTLGLVLGTACLPLFAAKLSVAVSSVTTNSPLSYTHSEDYACKRAGEDNPAAERTVSGDSLAGWGEAVAEAEATGATVHGPTATAPKPPPPPPLAKEGADAKSTASFELSVSVVWTGNAVTLSPAASTPTITVERCPRETPAEYNPRYKAFKEAVTNNVSAIVQAVNAASPVYLSNADLSLLLKGRSVTRQVVPPPFFKDQQTLVITIVGKKITDQPLGGG